MQYGDNPKAAGALSVMQWEQSKVKVNWVDLGSGGFSVLLGIGSKLLVSWSHAGNQAT